MLKKGLVILGFAALFGGSPVTAQAMPIDRSLAATETMVDQVAMGCGRGWTRNRWGRCVPFRHFGPPVYVVPRYRHWGPRYYHGPRRFYGGHHRHW